MFSEPFMHWNDATHCFKNHTGSETAYSKTCLHDSTSAILMTILSRLSGKTQLIEIMIDENKKKIISDNKKKTHSNNLFHQTLWSSWFGF